MKGCLTGTLQKRWCKIDHVHIGCFGLDECTCYTTQCTRLAATGSPLEYVNKASKIQRNSAKSEQVFSSQSSYHDGHPNGRSYPCRSRAEKHSRSPMSTWCPHQLVGRFPSQHRKSPLHGCVVLRSRMFRPAARTSRAWIGTGDNLSKYLKCPVMFTNKLYLGYLYLGN